MYSLYKIRFVILCILYFLSLQSNAQHLSFFDISSDQYPRVEANFFAFDGQLNQIITLKKEDVTIQENGINQTIIQVINPKPKSPTPVSVVLTVDISGSMKGDGIEKAKNATAVFVRNLPLDISECALTSFDGYNYVNADFSQNKQLLLEQINTFIPNGGTDYNVAFNTPQTGALEIVKKGKNKKVIIFLTDGLADANKEEIIAKAAKDGVHVYCITLGMNMPEVLKTISTQTGGRFYQNVNTKEEMKKVYEEIFFHVQEYEPSRVIWESKQTCTNTKLTLFRIPKMNMTANSLIYLLSPAKGIALLSNKQVLDFPFKELNMPIHATVNLTAKNADFTLTSFASTMLGLKLKTPALPTTIKKGEQMDITFELSPKTANYASGSITLNNKECNPLNLYAKATPQGGLIKNTVYVESPNGGETLFTGSDTVITWTGVSSETSVKLSYSLDDGKTWSLITDDAKNGSYHWTIPSSTTSLAKVKVEPKGGFNATTVKSWEKLYSVPFGNAYHATLNSDQNCTKFFLRTPDNQIIVKDAYTGKTLSTFPVDKHRVFFNEDGSRINLVKEGEEGKVYDATTGYELETLPVFKKIKEVSVDGKEYLHEPESGSMEIVNIQTGDKVSKVKSDFKGSFIPFFDENYFIYASRYDGTSDYECYVWNRSKGKYEIFKTPEKNNWRALLSGDNKYLVCWSWSHDGSNIYITVFDFKTKEKLYSIQHGAIKIQSLQTLMVGNKLMMCPIDGKLAVVEISSGKVMHTFTATSNDWFFLSRNDQIVLHNDKASQTTSAYPTGYFKMPEVHNESDESDQVFNIASAKLEVKDVTFNNVTVNEREDQLVGSFIKNPNPFALEIKSIDMPKSIKDLSLLAGDNKPFILKPNESIAVEFSFKPGTTMDTKEIISIKTNRGTFRATVNLNAVSPTFKIPEKTIYLGKFKVGTVHDTTLNALIENAGYSAKEITSIELNGPGKEEYRIANFSKKTLNSGDRLNLDLKFTANKRGISTCQLHIKTNDPSHNAIINVIAEGISPTVYKVKATSFDKTTRQKLASTISCYDVEAKHMVKATPSSIKGEAYFALNADRKYMIQAKKTDYSADSMLVDLTKFSQSMEQEAKLYLESINQIEAASFLLYGAFFDDTSQEPIVGKLIIVNKTSGDTLWKSAVPKTEEGYRVFLPFGQDYELLAESDNYFPSKTLLQIVENDKKDNQLHFYLSRITPGKSINLKNVLFVQSKAELLPSSYEELSLLLKYLVDNPELNIELSGHTDNQGIPKLNIKLSNERVLAIKKYLTDNGIDEKRISGKGYGDKFPIASNTTEATRKLNRRVEFKILENKN